LTLTLGGIADEVEGATCAGTGIVGPLRVSSINPRYFTNDCGKAVYLTGTHTWNNFPDMDDDYPPENAPFDFNAYLDFLESYGHTFIRLWAWETPFPDNADYYPRRVWAGPQPWIRTGPGVDVVGLPKFNLSSWNQAYFDRLRARVLAAQSRGIYVSIMLFEGWEVQFAPGRLSHPFNRDNNVNNVHFGSDLTNIHTLTVPAITSLQEEYVRRVVDAVNDLDNVMYEVCNECGGYSISWQQHMLTFVRQFESTKPKQHPLGMTYVMGNSDAVLYSSSAEWISPGATTYYANPAVATGSKVILTDNDHYGGSSIGDPVWVWKSFARGLNPIFMDRYVPPDSIASAALPNAQQIRRAMGQTARFAARMDLLSMTPIPSRSSTGYVLASPDEYLVYAPSGGSFSVDMSGSSGTFATEWLDPGNDSTHFGADVSGGATRTFQAPFSGPAVLYLTDASGPPSGPVLAYGFEEGNGSTVLDRSGRGNTGTISGATWTTGQFGSALQFNGSSAFVFVPDAPSLDLTSGMTLEAWVYPETSTSSWRDIIYKTPDVYYLEGSSPVGAPATGGSFSASPLYGVASLPIRTWSHLAATYDGAVLRLYVNGNQVASRSQTGSIVTSSGNLTLGADSTFGQYWNGRIDEVRVYSRALTPSEIAFDRDAPVVVSAGIGEATLLGASRSASGIDLTFDPACGASNHAAFWGTSPIVSDVAWSGAACGLGMSGSASVALGTPAPGKFVYVVIVGHTSSIEGSYGQDSTGLERPEAIGMGVCDMPQDLVAACP
jgi:hypothetical protein